MKLTKKKLKEIREVLGSNVKIKKASKKKKPKIQRKVSSVVKLNKAKKHHDMSRTEWEACGKKVRYHSQHEARQVANNCERLRPETKLRVYWCPFCDGWHVTSQEFRQRRDCNQPAATAVLLPRKDGEAEEKKKKQAEAKRRQRQILNKKIKKAAKQVASVLGL